ncbi:MAG: amidase [Pseudomonadota bacterium]
MTDCLYVLDLGANRAEGMNADFGGDEQPKAMIQQFRDDPIDRDHDKVERHMTGEPDMRAGTHPNARNALEACVARIEENNLRFNAVAELFLGRARDRADMLDRAALDGQPLGALHGVPILFKGLVDIEGYPTVFGSVAFATSPAARNAPVIDRLEAAGAIVFGTTNMVEFAVGGWGTNAVQGTPWNPADLTRHRVAGGSSSGSAVAVAAGFAPIAFGSDTGGSVRIPATLCGIVGFKPSYGLIPLQGVAATGPSFDTLGPLARSVGEARIAAEAAAGMRFLHPPVSLNGLRLLHLSDAALAPADPAVMESYHQALARLAQAGAVAEEITLPLSLFDVQMLNGDIVAYEAYRQLRAIVDNDAAEIDPFVRQRVRHGAMIDDAAYRQLLMDLHAFRQSVQNRFDDADVLVLPGTPLPAPPVDEVDESEMPMSRYTRLSNCLNHCAIALPIAANPLPTGIQLAASHGRDAKLLAIAEAVEALLQSG